MNLFRRWPAAFGAVDRKSQCYRQGEKLYGQYCASCHDRREGEDEKFKGFGVYKLDEIGTDRERADTFAKARGRTRITHPLVSSA